MQIGKSFQGRFKSWSISIKNLDFAVLLPDFLQLLAAAAAALEKEKDRPTAQA